MMGEMIRTKCSTYILPMLGADRTYYSFKDKLMNVYMFEESYPGIDGYIYLLYKIRTTDFHKSDTGQRVSRHKMYVGDYGIYAGDGYSMVIFQLPDSYSQEIKMFWTGKYSEFGEFYKMAILSFHGAIDNSKLHGILGKKPHIKKDLEKSLTVPTSPVTIPNGMDLDSKPLITQETFFYKKLFEFEERKKCDTTRPVSDSLFQGPPSRRRQ